MVLDDGFTNVLNLLHVALEVKDLAEDDFENFLNVDGLRSGTENDRSLHGLGVFAGLMEKEEEWQKHVSDEKETKETKADLFEGIEWNWN